MIQRIQSIYLSAIVSISILFFFVPLINIEVSGKYYILNIVGIIQNANSNSIFILYAIPLLCISVFTGSLSLIVIFLFKKRPMQIIICKIIFILNLVLVLLIFYFYPDIIIKNKLGSNASYNYTAGALLPLISLIFILLANRAICKDEKLVKESNRIR